MHNLKGKSTKNIITASVASAVAIASLAPSTVLANEVSNQTEGNTAVTAPNTDTIPSTGDNTTTTPSENTQPSTGDSTTTNPEDEKPSTGDSTTTKPEDEKPSTGDSTTTNPEDEKPSTDDNTTKPEDEKPSTDDNTTKPEDNTNKPSEDITHVITVNTMDEFNIVLCEISELKAGGATVEFTSKRTYENFVVYVMKVTNKNTKSNNTEVREIVVPNKPEFTSKLDVNITKGTPVFTGKDITITVGDKFDPKKDITAKDAEDGDLTSKITIYENTVKTNTPGTYKVVYEVSDKDGNLSTFVRKVTVKAKAVASTNQKPNNTNPQTGDVGVLGYMVGFVAAGAALIGLKKRNN